MRQNINQDSDGCWRKLGAELYADVSAALGRFADSDDEGSEPESDAPVYDGAGINLLKEHVALWCFRCQTEYIAPEAEERDNGSEEICPTGSLRELGFRGKCRKVFAMIDSVEKVANAMLGFHSVATLTNPPSYYREVQPKLRSHEFKALEMDERISNVMALGLSLESANPRAGVVSVVNPGQAEKQGIKKDDYVVQLGGWWIPPLAHPRRAELLDVLRGRFIGGS